MSISTPRLPAIRRRLAAPARREQILGAATRLFIERGFEAVSMADLAQALGISRPAVYSYFASTEAVLEVLLADRLGQLWGHLEGLLPASSSGQQPQAGVYSTLFQFLIGERESLLLLHSGGGPTFQARRSAFLGDLGRRIEAQYPNIRRRPYQLAVVTQLLDSLAYYAVQQQLQDVQALADTLDSFLRGGVAQLAQDQPTQGQAAQDRAAQDQLT